MFGPIIGAFILTPLGEALIAVTEQLGAQCAGRQGRVLRPLPDGRSSSLAPNGVWPWIARRLGISTERQP